MPCRASSGSPGRAGRLQRRQRRGWSLRPHAVLQRQMWGKALQGVESRDAGHGVAVDQRGRAGGVVRSGRTARPTSFAARRAVHRCRRAQSQVHPELPTASMWRPASRPRSEGGLPSPPRRRRRVPRSGAADAVIVAVAISGGGGDGPGRRPDQSRRRPCRRLPSAPGDWRAPGRVPLSDCPRWRRRWRRSIRSVPAWSGPGGRGEHHRGRGLGVGNVTVTQRRAMLDGIIRVAWAQRTDRDGSASRPGHAGVHD